MRNLFYLLICNLNDYVIWKCSDNFQQLVFGVRYYVVLAYLKNWGVNNRREVDHTTGKRRLSLERWWRWDVRERKERWGLGWEFRKNSKSLNQKLMSKYCFELVGGDALFHVESSRMAERFCNRQWKGAKKGGGSKEPVLAMLSIAYRESGPLHISLYSTPFWMDWWDGS